MKNLNPRIEESTTEKVIIGILHKYGIPDMSVDGSSIDIGQELIIQECVVSKEGETKLKPECNIIDLIPYALRNWSTKVKITIEKID